MNEVDKDPGPALIAFSGKKQVGKDSSADYATGLFEARGLKVGRTAFADALKRTIAIDILGMPEENVFGTDEQKNQLSDIVWESFGIEIRMAYPDGESLTRTGRMTFREVLQVIGTDIFRALDADVWVKATFRKIKSQMSHYDVVMLTDCRFPNEKQLTDEQGGVNIRLERPDFAGVGDPHPSETALDQEYFKYHFKGGTLKELFDFVTTVLQAEKLLDGVS